jgi:hypothetical protein
MSEDKFQKRKDNVRTEEQKQFICDFLFQCYSVCISFKILPVLFGGVLLGIQRDGDIMDHDMDGDFAVLTDTNFDLDKLDQAFRDMGYTTKVVREDCSEKISVYTEGDGTYAGEFGIDFMRFYKDGGIYFRRLFGRKKIVPCRFFDETQTISFRGHEFSAPIDIVGYLEHNYGEWQTKIIGPLSSYLSKDFYGVWEGGEL